ncbi:TadE family protein [Erythrobacter alti]|uniref:TadE/TadG family type IV pilus assembly protein n=1 Tax=Erythrobacter alti TaxID=1896145 RepID=UPI0030F49CA6
MISLASFKRDQRASSAAEFALVLPAFLILLLGTIDVGRYMWNVGQAEKATMMGARYAVVTNLVPSDLYTYSFAVDGGIEQGTVVTQTDFPGVTCSSNSGTVQCQCKTGGSCAFGLTADADAFNAVVLRMRSFYGGIGSDNVVIDYSWSGLGYSGDPHGADVDPIVTVFLKDLPFRPLITGTMGNLGLPGTSHSLTMEDGAGTRGN